SAHASLTDPDIRPLAINPDQVRKILARFIQNQVQKVSFERDLLGLSGGLASSMVVTLASHALEPTNQLAVIMPFKTNEHESYGDMASALNPVGDLYKTQVWQLADALGVPTAIVQKAPSADLWSGQSDETELGFAYRMVDQLLYYLVDRRYSREELARLGFEPAFVDDIIRRVRDNQYKRRLPVIAKLSSRTVDQEFRYPRDWGH